MPWVFLDGTHPCNKVVDGVINASSHCVGESWLLWNVLVRVLSYRFCL